MAVTAAEWDQILIDLGGLDAERALRAVRLLRETADDCDVPRLRDLVLNGEDFFHREVAAAPLARLEGAQCLPLLFEAMLKGEREGHDNDSLCFVITELFESQPNEAAPLLLDMIDRTNSDDRKNAAWGLGWMTAETAKEPLLRAIEDKSPEVRAAAAGSLGHPRFKEHPEVLEALVKVLTDSDELVRTCAASAIGYLEKE